MKDFFKNVAATIVGLFAFGLIMTILDSSVSSEWWHRATVNRH